MTPRAGGLVAAMLAVVPATAAAPAETVCLVHAGPSDKPLPTICLGGEPPEADPFLVALPRTAEIEALFDALIAGAAASECDGEVGTYRVEGTSMFVCGAGLRSFVAGAAALIDVPQLAALEARLH